MRLGAVEGSSGRFTTRPLERDSPMPMWGQVLRDLRQQIDTGRLPADSRLPSETELAHAYGVSRDTLRQALRQLEDNGLIRRARGSGTFVSSGAQHVQHDLALGVPWRTRLKEAGHEIACSLVRNEETSAPPEAVLATVGEDVRLDEFESGAIHVERIQWVDHRPIGLSQSWLPSALTPGITTQMPLIDNSLSLFLKRQHGLHSGMIDNRMAVGLATAEEAELLESFVDVPLFVVTAVTRTESGGLIQVSRSLWLASRVRFRSIRVGRSEPIQD